MFPKCPLFGGSTVYVQKMSQLLPVTRPSPFPLIVRRCGGKGLGNRLDCARSASWNAGAGVRMQLATSRPAGQKDIVNDIHNIT